MFKSVLLIALAVGVASAQYAAPPAAAVAPAQDGGDSSNAAPEPYSYGYETDTHSAAEQRDPSGRVTGFYTIADADGRQRRVEYVADESGFRAKVQTNEVGTKSQNSADVEVQASPANPEQYYQYQQQAPAAVVQQQPARVVSQQVGVYQQQPQQLGRYQYVQQQGYNYGGYYPAGQGYQYGASYYNQPSYAYGAGYGALGYGNYGANSNRIYSSYNNHLPSQYYSALGAAGNVNGLAGGQFVSGSRYVSSVQPANQIYRTGGYQTVDVQQPSVATSSSGASLRGSSNYIVLKKRGANENSSSTTTSTTKRPCKTKQCVVDSVSGV